jgi:prevent-host-death family protein
MRTLPLSEVKAHLSEITDEVVRTHERVTVTRNGRDAIVLLSVADLDSIEATLELLADPAAQDRVAHAEAEISAGETATLADLQADLALRKTA